MIGYKRIVVLGSTGSIGRSTLSVARAHQERIGVVALSAARNKELLAEQIIEFKPLFVAMEDESCADELRQRFSGLTVFGGVEAAVKMVEAVEADQVVAAISGMAGLAPTMAAIGRGLDIALANKEALVSAGHLLLEHVKENGVTLLPVDSEHSAIWQALRGSSIDEVEKLILTASGGPFFGRTRSDLAGMTAHDALRHPTWQMGGKISVDSATLMNKGLEVIEAHHLFGVDYDRIKVMIHPQSVVHSLVEFIDGSQLAQCSHPDMRIPIQLALSYPKRWPSTWVDNEHYAKHWSFYEPDLDSFRCLRLAIEAGRQGGAYPAVLNAANEVAVENFLKGRIGFLDIEYVVETVLNQDFKKPVDIQDVYVLDSTARKAAAECIKSKAVK